MPFAGTQLSIEQALALCSNRGWSGTDLTTAVCVMTAESGRFTKAFHNNLNPDGSIKSTDRGLFQINDKEQTLSDEKAFNGVENAKFAHALRTASGWTPWAAFSSGRWRIFRAEVRAVRVVHPFRWRRLRATIDAVVDNT
jgi:hypothetical protein